MAAYYPNQYLVNSGDGKPENGDTKLFQDLARQSKNFQKFAKMASPDGIGVYECFFLKDGILYSGTTKIPPTQDIQSYVLAMRVHHSVEGPVRMWIPSTSENVLWYISARQ